MKKVKKTKTPQRRTELDRIAARLHAALRRETKNIIEIGDMLIESRRHLEHGEWQSWLAENFDLSYYTARNYMVAVTYVERRAKSGTVQHFENLSPTVLYGLAAGHYNEQEEAAILAATSEGRVDQTRASEICDEIAPPDSEEPDPPDDADKHVESEAEDDPESAAILDGTPPDVPQPAPITTPDFTLRAFDQAVNALKQLMTKPAARFASTIHSANDLETVESFIRAVTKAKVTPPPANRSEAMQRGRPPR